MPLVRPFVAAAAAFLLLTCADALAQLTSPEISRGLAWLQGRVQADGSLQDENASVGSVLQARSEAARTLRQLAVVPPALVDAVGGFADDDTETLARRIDALQAAGRDTSAPVADLLARQNTDGGFGPLAGFDSTTFDTAFALEALAAAAPSATAAASAALSYLTTRQGPDGAFRYASDISDHYATVLAMHAMWRFRSVFALAAPIGAARTFLLAGKAADGTWFTTDLTAAALISILPTQATTDGVADSIAALKAAQLADGSWDGDSYTTALALRALAIAAAPTTNPDLATLAGRVVNGTSLLPLEGATVAIAGKEARTFVTDATGQFAFDQLVAGTYEFSVARAGFGGIKGTVALQPGQGSSLGDLVLLPVVAPTTVTLRGVVTDAASGAPVNAASVVAGTKSVTTSPTGTYEITGLPPGDISIRVAAAGFFAALATANGAAGQTIIFSPQLVRATATTTTIKGRVTNRATDAPLANATVRLTGANTRTAATDNTGAYALTGLAPGPTQVDVLLAGFATASATLTVDVNVTYDFSPALDPVPAGGSLPRLSGRMTDAITLAPLAVGTVVLSGANTASARTDANGFYQLDNLAAGRSIVAFSAPGYQSVAVPVDLAASVSRTLPMALFPDGFVNPNGSITGRAVDEVSLLPVAAAVVSAQLDESTKLFAIAGDDGRFAIAGGLEGSWTVTVGRSGYQDATTSVLIAPNGKVALGDVKLRRQADVTRLPDLVVSLIDRTRLASDPLTFRATGQVDVQVSNIGNAATVQSSRVVVYVDVDRDGRFDPAIDTVIGTARLATLLDSRAFATVTIDVAGTLPFRDAPFRVRVDADDEIVELNELNNEASSADLGVCK